MAPAPSARLAIQSSLSSFAIASTAETDIKWRAPARLRPRWSNDKTLIKSSHSLSEKTFASIQYPQLAIGTLYLNLRFRQIAASVFEKRVLPLVCCRRDYPAPSNRDMRHRRFRFRICHPSSRAPD